MTHATNNTSTAIFRDDVDHPSPTLSSHAATTCEPKARDTGVSVQERRLGRGTPSGREAQHIPAREIERGKGDGGSAKKRSRQSNATHLWPTTNFPSTVSPESEDEDEK